MPGLGAAKHVSFLFLPFCCLGSCSSGGSRDFTMSTAARLGEVIDTARRFAWLLPPLWQSWLFRPASAEDCRIARWGSNHNLQGLKLGCSIQPSGDIQSSQLFLSLQIPWGVHQGGWPCDVGRWVCTKPWAPSPPDEGSEGGGLSADQVHVLHALKENLLAGALDASEEALALPRGGQCDPLSAGSLHA